MLTISQTLYSSALFNARRLYFRLSIHLSERLIIRHLSFTIYQLLHFYGQFVFVSYNLAEQKVLYPV